MKKIIYSLVIMIAAGSLFTSCIEQVEPVGLLDMRTAKAEYIRALKDLRAADATYRRAQADVEQAKAALIQAKAAYQASLTAEQEVINEYKRLLNEAQEMKNEYDAAVYEAKIAELEMQIAEKRAKHEVTMVKCETALAQAQETLRTVLRDIAIAAKSLSPNEKLAVAEAAALYYALIQQEITVQHAVDSLQITVDTLVEYKLRFADTAWSNGKLVGVVEKYENDIAYYEAMIALDVIAAAAVPDTAASLEEWKKALDAAKEVAQEIKVKKAQQTFDSTGYVEAVINPGIARFNAAIAEFIVNNWDEDTSNVAANKGKYYEPALTSTEATTLSLGEPKADDQTRTDYWEVSGSPAKTEFTSADFKQLKDLNKKTHWFEKFAYMVASETAYGQQNPYNTDAEASARQKQFIDTVIAAKSDTMKIQGPIKADMKSFLVGDPDGDGAETRKYNNGKVKLTADYGLWGAYEVLNRVYTKTQRDYVDSAQVFADSASFYKTKWQKEHDVLAAGLEAFKPYADSMALFIEAVDAYNAKNKAMANAINAFITEWNQLNGTGEDWNEIDSTQAITAITTFAKAREEYLPGWEDTTAKRYGQYRNPAYLYYVSHGNPVEIDSVKISELTFNDIRKTTKINVKVQNGGDATNNRNAGKYSVYEIYPANFTSENPDLYAYSNLGMNTVVDGLGHINYYTDHGVFDYIVTQMMGKFAHDELIRTKTVSDGDTLFTWPAIANSAEGVAFMINLFNDKTGADTYSHRPLFNDWAYKNTTEDITKGEVVWANNAEGVYTATLLEAEQSVINAVAEYVKVYDSYWGKQAIKDTAGTWAGFAPYFEYVIADDDEAEEVTTEAGIAAAIVGFDKVKLMDEDKLKSNHYELSIFRRHEGDNTPLVWFKLPDAARVTDVASASIDANSDFLTLLASVDPYSTADVYFDGGALTSSAVMYGGLEKKYDSGEEKDPIQTTAFKALFWDFQCWMASEEGRKVFTEDLKKIEEWIKGVQDVFDNNKDTRTKTFSEANFQKAVTAYKKAVDRKKEIGEYLKEKEKFVGTHIEHHKVPGVDAYKDSAVLNDLMLAKNGSTGKPITEVKAPNANLKNNEVYFITSSDELLGSEDDYFFEKNLIGTIVGWNEDVLGGTQLENANECFGEDLPEMVQEMRVNLKKWENQEADAEKFYKLYNEVAMAKAELEGYTAQGTSGAGQEDIRVLYAKYKDSYEKLIKAYADDIVEYRKKIDAAKHYIAAYKSEVPDFDGLIAAAEEDLKHAQAALKAIQKAKEQAKINLDKIMEYISSTDAEFVIPVTVQDMQMMINNLSAVLDEFDIDIEKLLAGYLIEAGIIADPDVDADGDGE